MQHKNEDENIDLTKIFNRILSRWYWFVISIILCFSISLVYLQYTAPTYQIGAKLLVNDDGKATGGGASAAALMDLGGIFGSNSSVDNEAEILRTRFLLEQVVRDMQLNIVYGYKSGIKSRELYETPFKVNIIESLDTISATRLIVKLHSNNSIKVNGKNLDKNVRWNEKFELPGVGKVQLIRDNHIRMTDGVYFMDIKSIDERVDELNKQISIDVSNKQVTIINLQLSYSLPAKGEDILNTLINRYTLTNLKDKNSIADSTFRFISERLSVIASELGDVENAVEGFKKQNRLADMSEQSKLLVQRTGDFTSELAKVETQLSVVNDLEKYLNDESKNKRVFPASLLPSDVVFSDLMAQYNKLLIERDHQLLSVTETSPFIKNIDDQIAGLRQSIIANIQSSKNSIILTRNKLRKQINSAEGEISDVPQVERNYLKLARNQKIKEELYIFLMQKAEETAISKSSNLPIAKVIDPPKSQVIPVNPKASTVYLVGLMLGIILPVAIILISDALKTTVLSKEDITSQTDVPIIGEISHNNSSDNLIVANSGRSAISEQFRALRTNLSFFLNDKEEKFILLTSSMSGEGKSFTAINLGLILALAGKKVLLMELDLRKPGLSAKLNIPNTSGFSNFTISPEMEVSDILRPVSINKNMYIISSGPLPPNPAETLMSERTTLLMDELRNEFDYIIMDAPPIGIITDAQLLSQYANTTIYMVRQKYTQKAQIKIVDELYKTNKMRNLGIVVNDIVNKDYGYGYGYGNYAEETTTSWYQKFVKKVKG